MKRILFLTSLLVPLFIMTNSCKEQTKAEDLGWKLSVQSYTFHRFSLMETFDKCNELGVKYMEVFPGHRLGGRWGDTPFDANLDDGSIKELLEIVASKGLKIVGSGVFVSDEKSEWEKMFAFASKMGLEFVSCEPPVEMWDFVEELSDRYGIQVAVHNHPRPSQYWCPDSLLAAIQGRSGRIGSCADVGHWNREGLDHLECLRKLDGRLISFHFKDIREATEDGAWRDDTIWGQGVLNINEMLRIMKEQKFKGYLSIEYEYNWDNSVPDIKQCIEAFNKAVAAL